MAGFQLTLYGRIWVTPKVTATAPGFKSYKTSIQLLVAQSAVINPSMTAGAVTQQVEVTGDAVQLTTTDSGTLSSTLENQRINQLPMNGRDVSALAGATTPGLEGGGVRANGLMYQGMEWVQDGAPNVNRNYGGPDTHTYAQAALPDPDSIQEVKVLTTSTGAQYATPSTVILTTKSGTNALHGSMFETARNNAVGIAKARQNPVNFAAPHLVRNEWGVNAGGPIILPHVYHGKDKSFWFAAFERYSQASAATVLATVPTKAMTSGDFSGLINGAGQLQVLYDPATTANSANCNGSGTANAYCRTPFANNQIPINRISPLAQTLYAMTPAPTSTDNPLVASNFAEPDNTWQVAPTLALRFDHSFNDKNQAYLRYSHNISQTRTLLNQNYTSGCSLGQCAPATLAYKDFPAGASGVLSQPNATFMGSLGFTHVFSPTFFSETVASQQWQVQKSFKSVANLPYEKWLGLPNNFGGTGFPSIDTLTMNYFSSQGQNGINQIISNLDENLTKIVGKHQMQFGGRYRHERFGYLVDGNNDEARFAALSTALENPGSGANYSATANTGYADADFFLGSLALATVNLEPPYIHAHDMEFDAYFNDNFHVTRNLTVNLGLRWEAHPAPWIKDGLMTGFDLKNDAMVLTGTTSELIAKGYTTQALITNMQYDGVKFETTSQAGFPSAIMRNYNLTIGPRVGFAYLPFSGKYGTVIRAAYGRFTYPVPIRSSWKDSLRFLPMAASYTQNYASAAQSPDGLPNYQVRNPQLIVAGVNSANVVNTSSTKALTPGFSIWDMNPDSPPTYVTNTTFTIEQPLKGNAVFQLSGVWTHGTNLDQAYYYNFHPSTYAWEMQSGITPPTGGASVIGTPAQNTYSSTATGPYDQTTYGSNALSTKMGWSNDTALQANYQRIFHRGIAYQITYVWSAPFRAGGNGTNDTLYYTSQVYQGNTGGLGTMTSPYGTVISPILPPARPAGIAPYLGWHELDKYEDYIVDTAIPKQHIQFNGILELPFGRGKRFLGNSNRLLDELIGGFQLAGDGSIASQAFQVGTGNWGPTNPLKVYKHNAPITDCRSGVCHAAFEWFNGYVPPSVVNATTKGVSGLPGNWAPYQVPIDNTVGTTYYGLNEVQVGLTNGTSNAVPYSPGPASANPFYHTFLNGPINYTIDLSVFKVFPITERVNLRFNLDAFNALNMQGYNNPSATDGTESLLRSYNTPRQLQFTLRLQF